MSTTQFAMVEELASLIKDNIPSKHLLLAVEEALVNYLNNDQSPDGILHLEPMSSYNRLILHRLADIFGFAHESFGEGDDRHLVLRRCLETSVPPILVSDILWQQDSCESPPTPYQFLKRADSCLLKVNAPSLPNYLEREAAYMAARERIFGVEEVDIKEATKQKPRVIPVVARRMISHALGQRTINQCTQVKDNNIGHTDDSKTVSDIERRVENFNLQQKSELTKADKDEVFLHKARDIRSSVKDGSQTSTSRMREENMGGAKRIFAHALGKQGSRNGGTRCRDVNSVVK